MDTLINVNTRRGGKISPPAQDLPPAPSPKFHANWQRTHIGGCPRVVCLSRNAAIMKMEDSSGFPWEIQDEDGYSGKNIKAKTISLLGIWLSLIGGGSRFSEGSIM